jgi:hypothetical protein
MIYMWFTGINYYKLAIEKDRVSIFATVKLRIGICKRQMSVLERCLY